MASQFYNQEQGKYVYVWKKYFPVIRLLLKRIDKEAQTLKIDKQDLEAVGVRDKAGHSFNLEIRNGKAAKEKTANPIARDLMSAIKENTELYTWFKSQNIKINMGKDFVVHIQKLDAPEAAPVAAE